MEKTSQRYEGLYNIYINPYSGSNSGDKISIGAQGDSFYEYLIKSWVLSNGTDGQSRRMFDTSADAIAKHLLQKSRSGDYQYTMHNGKKSASNDLHLTMDKSRSMPPCCNSLIRLNL